MVYCLITSWLEKHHRRLAEVAVASMLCLVILASSLPVFIAKPEPGKEEATDKRVVPQSQVSARIPKGPALPPEWKQAQTKPPQQGETSTSQSAPAQNAPAHNATKQTQRGADQPPKQKTSPEINEGAGKPIKTLPTLPSSAVLAYYPEDYPGDISAYRALAPQVKNVDVVAYFGYFLDEWGNLSGWKSTPLENLARPARIPLLLTIHNARNGAFDRETAHRLLANPSARKTAVKNIVQALGETYAGVNLDLEAVPPGDRDNYTGFVRELAEALHQEGKLLTLAIPAKTWDDPSNGWSAAFDYEALGKTADYVVIMSYDEHWLQGAPGPIASLNWVEKVAAYTSRTIPPGKVLLGIAGYAYDWSVDGSVSRALSVPAAINLANSAGSGVAWDEAAQSPYFNYTDAKGRQRIVYFENAASTKAKFNIANRYGFAGVALWRLGLEDPAMWWQAKQS